MRKQMIFAALLGFALTAPALADDHAKDGADRMRDAVSAPAMRQKIDALGYDVLRLKSEHGRFFARIIDRQSGGGVDAEFSARTGDLIRARPLS